MDEKKRKILDDLSQAEWLCNICPEHVTAEDCLGCENVHKAKLKRQLQLEAEQIGPAYAGWFRFPRVRKAHICIKDDRDCTTCGYMLVGPDQ